MFLNLVRVIIAFDNFLLKETRISYFSVTPKNHRLMFVSLKRLKSIVTKKVIVCFNNLGEANL